MSGDEAATTNQGAELDSKTTRIIVNFATSIPNYDGFGTTGYTQWGRKSYANQKTADRAIAKFKAEHPNACVDVRG